MTTYEYEMTDTYGGEANYCWVKRGTITAKSFRGATIKAKRAVGWKDRHKITHESGDMRRIDVVGGCYCMFIWWK